MLGGQFAAAMFGKLENNPKRGQELFTRQLAFISPDEWSKLRGLMSAHTVRL